MRSKLSLPMSATAGISMISKPNRRMPLTTVFTAIGQSVAATSSVPAGITRPRIRRATPTSGGCRRSFRLSFAFYGSVTMAVSGQRAFANQGVVPTSKRATLPINRAKGSRHNGLSCFREFVCQFRQLGSEQDRVLVEHQAVARQLPLGVFERDLDQLPALEEWRKPIKKGLLAHHR